MKVIFHPTHGMNIDIQLSTNARNVSPQFGPKFGLDGFVPSFRTEHHMHHVLRVGMGHVPRLRRSNEDLTHPRQQSGISRVALLSRPSPDVRDPIARLSRASRKRAPEA